MNDTNTPYRQPSFRPSGSRGQNLLEFALVLPMLLFVVAGVLDLGRAFFVVIQVTNASREGVRYLTRNPDDYPLYDGTKAAAKNETELDIVVEPFCLGDTDGCYSGASAVVTSTHSIEMVMGWILPSPLTISRNATMVVP